MTSTVYAQWSWSGAPTLVVGIVTVPAVAVRSSLVHHWGQRGAVASIALAIPLFVALVMITPFTPSRDQEVVVFYPHAHAIWTFLMLSAIAVIRLVVCASRKIVRQHKAIGQNDDDARPSTHPRDRDHDARTVTST